MVTKVLRGQQPRRAAAYSKNRYDETIPIINLCGYAIHVRVWQRGKKKLASTFKQIAMFCLMVLKL